MPTKEPDKEIEIDKKVIRSLIDTQFCDLSSLPIEFLDSGWDNENYRLGSKYLVRLPRRKESANLIENEIKWLSFLESKLPIKIPASIKMGQPTNFYPWKWTINPWFEGDTADKAGLDDSEALLFVSFLKILHQHSPGDGPVNHYRGVDLEKKAKDVKDRIERLKLKTRLITKKIEKLWDTALTTSKSNENCLIHGDLHPQNIIVEDKKIKAVIDWGDITTGDPANDVASLWMIFNNKKTRQIALTEYGASQVLINRSIGWAIFFGTLLLDTGWGINEQLTNIGSQILRNINEE